MDDLNNNNEYLVHDAPVSIDELTSDLKGELGATKPNGFYAGDRGFMGAEQGPMEPEFVPYPPYGEFPPYPPYEEFPPYPMEGEFPPYPPMPVFYPLMPERPLTAKEQAEVDELESRLFGEGSLPVDRRESVVQFVEENQLEESRFMEPEELPEERSIFGRLFQKKEKPLDPPEMFEPHDMPEIDDTIEELAAELEKVHVEEPVHVEEVKAENIEEIFINSETGDVVEVEEAESFDEAEEFEEIEEIEMDSQGFRTFTKEQLVEMANPVADDEEYVEFEENKKENTDGVLYEAIDPAEKPAVDPKPVNEVFEGIGTSALDKIPEKYIFKL